MLIKSAVFKQHLEKQTHFDRLTSACETQTIEIWSPSFLYQIRFAHWLDKKCQWHWFGALLLLIVKCYLNSVCKFVLCLKYQSGSGQPTTEDSSYRKWGLNISSTRGWCKINCLFSSFVYLMPLQTGSNYCCSSWADIISCLIMGYIKAKQLKASLASSSLSRRVRQKQIQHVAR